jgi:hypothetical protein
MSPTQFAVRMADAEKRLEACRKAHNIAAMQIALAEMTQLIRSYYGTPHP